MRHGCLLQKLKVKFKVNLLFLTIMSFSYLSVMAQQLEKKTITGVVTDDKGEPIPGVTVTVKSDNKSSITNEQGKYSIQLGNNINTLIFKYLGFETKEVNIKDKLVVNVALVESVNALNEVVVIGYGSVKKGDLTGSVSTFKPKQIDAQQFNTVDDLLRGRAAGIQVVQTGGDPGAALSVKIRGTNSLRSNNEPLYVVDGIIMNNVTSDSNDPFAVSNANSGQTTQNGLTGINPQDIESIEVLKDASATAIYGSRGANGVVIITTKQGTSGKANITYTSNIGSSEASRKLPMLNATDYATYINNLKGVTYNIDTVKNINWQDELQRNGLINNNRLTFTGGSSDGKSKYYLAGGFLQNEGIVKNSFLKQGDVKINFSQTLTPKLKLDLTMSGLVNKNSMSMSTEATGNADNSMILKMLVGIPIKNARTDITDNSDPFDNPQVWLSNYDDLTNEKRLLGKIGFTYKFSNAFSYKVNIAGDYRNKDRKRWYGKLTSAGGNSINGMLGISDYERSFYQLESLINYTKKRNQSQVDATLGVTYDNELIYTGTSVNTNFASEALRTEGFGTGLGINPYFTNKTDAKTFSVLGRINYTLNDKYLFTVSGRSDGSSKFAPGNKFSFFPAASFAWKANNEEFLKDISQINELKLRFGYGRSGNQAITPYNTLARYSSRSYYVNGDQLVSSFAPQNIQNTNLKWETTDQLNLGLDLAVFKNKISLVVESYYKITRDLLQNFSLPTSSGYDLLVTNVGKIENKGLEFTLTGNLINKKTLTLTTSANISFNRNKILDVGLPTSTVGIYNWEGYIGPFVSTSPYFKDPANVFVVGQPIGMFYGFATNGVWQLTDNLIGVKQFNNIVAAGDLKYVDQNGDGDINDKDKILLGNPNPKYTYGFSAALKYKKIVVDMFFNGSYGAEVVNGNLLRYGFPNGANSYNILQNTYDNIWTPTNPSEIMPRAGYITDRFVDKIVEDASYLRLATLSIGYTFNLPNSKFLKNLGVNLVGKNLFTITKYTGYDPEVNSFGFNSGKIGVDWASYPNIRAYSLSLRANF